MNNTIAIKALIDIGKKCRAFKTRENRIYVAIGKYAIDVDSAEFAQYLIKEYIRDNDEIVNKPLVDNAIYNLRNGYWSPDSQNIHIRYAHTSEGIIVDIDHETDVLEISESGVRQIKEGSGLFIRKQQNLPLSGLVDNPDFELLYKYINVKEEDLALIAEFLVSCMRSEPPYPILHISGPAGSGKTTITKLIKAIIDPEENPLRSSPKTVEDLKVSAHNTFLLALDNSSSITRDFSNALCVIATGGTNSGRKLYTNNEEVAVDISRPVIINGLSSRVEFEDLAQRCRFIELDAISNHRKSATIINEFMADLPRIRMALYNAISESLSDNDFFNFRAITRLADVEAFAIPALISLGINIDSYKKALWRTKEKSLGGQAERIVIQALVSILENEGRFEGSTNKLVSKLEEAIDDNDDIMTSVTSDLRKLLNPRNISKFLINSIYRKHKGIEIDRQRTSSTRTLLITWNNNNHYIKSDIENDLSELFE